MTANTIATVQTGSRVSYQDMSNPLREGKVIGIEETPWGAQYGVRFDGDLYIHTTDLRQQGWTLLGS